LLCGLIKFLFPFFSVDVYVWVFMDWKGVDERLVKRRELLLSLEFLEGYDRELKRMNRGKVGL